MPSVAAIYGVTQIDRSAVMAALHVLIDPGQTFELRGLPGGRSRVCRGSDLDGAVEAARQLGDGTGVYFTLNPCRHDLTAAAHVDDILSRRWLLVDVDPERPAGTNSTEAEKQTAGVVVCAVLDYLDGLGWPAPVMVDSGNGWHLLYRVDLPNTELARILLKKVLAELAARFDTDWAKVDKAVHNASRISKLPGTWARKGEHSPERPHRLARMLAAPSACEVVTTEQLEALVRKEEKPLPPQPTYRPSTNGVNGHGLESYVRSAIDRECYRILMAAPGAAEGRNNALNRAAHSLGTMSSWPEMSEGFARAELLRSALQAGLTERESEKTIESGWSAGAGKPRERPVETVHRNGVANGKPAAPIPAGGLIIWAKDVVVRKVEWLWPRRIPVGKQTTFAGQTGMGKTFAVCDLAARITRGMEIPFGGGECFQQGKVLMISAEDDADDTIVPRFLELGGDPSRLAFLSPESEDQFNLSALELLNRSLDAMGSDVRMVAIDPPTSFLAGADDHKNAELRGLLTPLKRWCQQRRIALILVTHVNKAVGSNVDAMARVMGSAAWVQAVRAAHMFCPDPDQKERSLFMPLKVNNAKKPKGLSYHIEETHDDLAVIKWTGDVEMSADEAMANKEMKKPRAKDAREWLIDMFTRRREWPSDLFWVELRSAGVTEYAFKQIREMMEIPKSRRVATQNGDVTYVWWVPPNWRFFAGVPENADHRIETEAPF